MMLMPARYTVYGVRKTGEGEKASNKKAGFFHGTPLKVHDFGKASSYGMPLASCSVRAGTQTTAWQPHVTVHQDTQPWCDRDRLTERMEWKRAGSLTAAALHRGRTTRPCTGIDGVR
jgi:hypothetical protein